MTSDQKISAHRALSPHPAASSAAELNGVPRHKQPAANSWVDSTSDVYATDVEKVGLARG